MSEEQQIIHRYNPDAGTPDNLEFKHPLSEEWFKGLSACSLDFMRLQHELLFKEKKK